MQNSVKLLCLLIAVGVTYSKEEYGKGKTGSFGEGVSARSGTDEMVRNVVDKRRTKVVYVEDPCEEYGGYDNDFYVVEENPCVSHYEKVLIKTRPEYRPMKYYHKRPALPYPTWAPFKPLPMPTLKPFPTFPPMKPLPVVPLKPFKLPTLPTFKPLPVLQLKPLYKFPALPKYTWKVPTMPVIKPLPKLPPFKLPTFAPLKPLPAFKPISYPVGLKPVKPFMPVQQAFGYSFWSYPIQLTPGMTISPVGRHQTYVMKSAAKGMPNGYWVPLVHGSSSQPSLQTFQQQSSQTVSPFQAAQNINQGNVYASNMSFVILDCPSSNSDIRCNSNMNKLVEDQSLTSNSEIVVSTSGQSSGHTFSYETPRKMPLKVLEEGDQVSTLDIIPFVLNSRLRTETENDFIIINELLLQLENSTNADSSPAAVVAAPSVATPDENVPGKVDVSDSGDAARNFTTVALSADNSVLEGTNPVRISPE